MKMSPAVDVDRLLQELLPAATPLTDEALAVGVVSVLGQIALDVTAVIENAETPQQAFSQFNEVDIARQLYRSATAFAWTRRVLELRAAGKETQA